MNSRGAILLAGILLAGLAGWVVRQQLALGALRDQVARLGERNTSLTRDLERATQRATDFEQRAVALDTQLGSAKSRTTATETRHVQLTRELSDTRSRLTKREQREVELLAELAALREKIAAAREPAPAPAPNVVAPTTADTAPPPSVFDPSAYEQRIAELEQQLTELLTRALAETVPDPAPAIPPAPSPPPQVVRVGPHDSFVVIDYGRRQGARSGDVLRLQRGTTEVARVQISDARPRFSLAQVLPASLKGKLQSGDLIVLEN